jgi:hypothetical protein
VREQPVKEQSANERPESERAGDES